MLYLLCFGNPYLDDDNLAIKIADSLIANPVAGIEVVKCVSPEEILHYTDKDFVILDVVKDLTESRLIEDIDQLQTGKMVSLHDFDLGFFLKLMKETGRIEKVRIIGIPQKGDVSNLKEQVLALINPDIPTRGGRWGEPGKRENKRQVHLLVGVGNTTRSDDGIGPYIANTFLATKPQGWHVIDAGPVSENFTTPIRNAHPSTIILVDSADMKLKPGEFRIIPKERLDGLHMTTHAMPLSVLIDYLHKDIPEVKEIIFIGIQPKVLGPGEEISEVLERSAEKIIELLNKAEISSIPSLK